MVTMRRNRCIPLLLVACWLAAAVLASAPARAGTPLLIWPIDPAITSGQQATALWLENHGSQPATLQVRIFAWSQDGREEVYQPQQTVLPSPPIAAIAPGGRQLVRLIATRPAPAGVQSAYRIFIDELPAPDAPEGSGSEGAAVKLQLRYAVPLFVYGAGAVPPLTRTRDGPGALAGDALQPKLQWTTRIDGGKPFLVLSNSGNAHARVTAVEWQGPDGQAQSINPGLLGYVLAGASMRFAVASAPPRNAALRAQLNGLTADIPRAVD